MPGAEVFVLLPRLFVCVGAAVKVADKEGGGRITGLGEAHLLILVPGIRTLEGQIVRNSKETWEDIKHECYYS